MSDPVPTHAESSPDDPNSTETLRTRDSARRRDLIGSREGRVGPYKILETIGEGGFGTVYLAEQAEPIRRRVALKIIKAGMDTKQVIARFEAERQALALMNHPNVAKVLDAGATDKGRPYFVMEHVPGVRITEHCDRHRLDVKVRLDLFLQVCEAIQHAHQKGIIHRDIKPSNILVSVKEGKALPKVIDFGVAKATAGRLTDKTVYTEQGQFIGTPAYMSPEQAEMTAQDIDTRSDIYSLGVLLYELLTGTVPFDHRTLGRASNAEVQRILREVEPPKPSTRISMLPAMPRSLGNGYVVHPEGEKPLPDGRGSAEAIAQQRQADPPALRKQLRGDLDWITMKAMEKDRTRRYASASDFASDIARHLRHEPVLAGPPSARYRMKKFVRRNRLAVIAATAVFAALLLGMAATGIALTREAHQRRLVEEQRNRALEAEAAAQRRFKQVRELAHTFIFDFHDKIVDLQGATPAREFLVGTALRYLDNLAQEAGGDRELLRTLATAYRKVGDVQGYPDNPNLGDTSGALVSYRKGLDILEALPVDSQNAGERRDLMLGYQRIGDCQGWNYQQAEGIVYVRKALAIAEPLASATPQDPQALRDLAGVHVSLGWWLQGSQNADAAEHYRSAVRILESLRELYPDDVQTLRVLVKAYHRLSSLEQFRLGRTAAALGTARKMLEVAEFILQVEPGNQRVQYDAGNARLYIALALRRLGRDREAIEMLYQELRLAERRAEADPLDIEAKFDLVIMCSTVGRSLWKMGQYADGLEVESTKLRILEAVIQSHPDNAEAPPTVAAAYVSIGQCLVGMGDDDEAVVNARKAIAVLEPLLEKDPDRADCRQTLCAAYRLIGESLSALGQIAEAWASHDRALELAKALGATQADNPEQQRPLAMTLHCIGDLHLRSAEKAEALAKYRQAMEINEARLAFDPDVAEARRDLAVSYEKLGDVHAAFGRDEDTSVDQRQEQFREAGEWYERGLNILGDMRERDILPGRDAQRPDQIAAKLAKCESQIAEMHLRAGAQTSPP